MARSIQRRDGLVFAVFVVTWVLAAVIPQSPPWAALGVLALGVNVASGGYFIWSAARDGWRWLRRTPAREMARTAGHNAPAFAVAAAPVIWFEAHTWWWPTALAAALVWCIACGVVLVAADVAVTLARHAWRERRSA